MKPKIYSMLTSSDGFVSGEFISCRLGISRVAVWKHLRQMQDCGMVIESSPKGYRFVSMPDIPYPWCFGSRASRIHYFEELTSTMDEAMVLAQQGCPDCSVVVAERQTKGRGRLQRVWQSDEGGLYFTIITRPDLAPVAGALVSFALAIDLAATLNQCCHVDAQLKWPNDVLVNGCKLAGILAQMVNDLDRVQFINVGVGINVNNKPQHIEKPAISILQLKGHPVSRIGILSDFLERFEVRLQNNAFSDVVSEWKEHSITLGKHVIVQTRQETVKGLAVDVDKEGGLVLELANGDLQTIVYGDCFHQEGR
jgi:BirA family biotin operon repressor/biotin-[acetyl-CoA-carboxylase] ligase